MSQILNSSLVWIMGIGFASSVFLTKFFIFYANKLSLIDTPNHRSLHTIPTARGGGVVFVGIILVLSLFSSKFITSFEWISLWITLTILACLGFLDDLYSLTARKRIFIQSIAAIFFTASYLTIDPRILSNDSWVIFFGSLITVFVLVWSTNIFNFMDGSDGLAASQAILVLSGYLLSAPVQDLFFPISAVSLSCLAGFLIWNFPKAKVFMGDCGSGFLGCLLGCIWIHAIWIQNFNFAIGFLILYSPFIIDTSLTLFRRYSAGELWYSAHRMHAYQRIVHQGNFSHRKLLLSFWALSLVQFIIFVLWMKHHSAILVFTSAFISLLSYIAIEIKAPFVIKSKI